MSQYSRNERNANAGIVVGITPEDYPAGPLAGIDFQRELESRAYVLGGSNYNAPGQLVGDFIAGKSSQEFGEVLPSYQPGVSLGELDSALPTYAIEAIREALPAFDRQIRGFAMNDAVLTGVETRTSSPVRVRRGADFLSVPPRPCPPTHTNLRAAAIYCSLEYQARNDKKNQKELEKQRAEQNRQREAYVKKLKELQVTLLPYSLFIRGPLVSPLVCMMSGHRVVILSCSLRQAEKQHAEEREKSQQAALQKLLADKENRCLLHMYMHLEFVG
jgi:hypothetical protein